MRYFAEERPRAPSGAPQYCDALGQGIAPVPAIWVEPTAEGGFELKTMLCHRRYVARYYHARVSDQMELLAFFNALDVDVEHAFEQYFGWSRQMLAAPAPAAELSGAERLRRVAPSLAALGLGPPSRKP